MKAQRKYTVEQMVSILAVCPASLTGATGQGARPVQVFTTSCRILAPARRDSQSVGSWFDSKAAHLGHPSRRVPLFRCTQENAPARHDFVYPSLAVTDYRAASTPEKRRTWGTC